MLAVPTFEQCSRSINFSHMKDRTPTILVVEDEFLIRAMLADYLQDCGFKVLEGSNADEAVAIIENMDTQIDLVLTDIRMPGSMDGFGLVRWISANRPDINVIMASTRQRNFVKTRLCLKSLTT